LYRLTTCRATTALANSSVTSNITTSNIGELAAAGGATSARSELGDAAAAVAKALPKLF
jgi:hypothetical protein